MQLSGKKITKHTFCMPLPFWQKTQFEETEQAAEPGMAGMLELSDQEFKTTMINMLRAKNKQYVRTECLYMWKYEILIKENQWIIGLKILTHLWRNDNCKQEIIYRFN